MTIIETLDALRDFIDREVASSIKLENPLYYEQGEPQQRYVNPKVYLGYAPNTDLNPDDHIFPGIIVGFDDEDDDGESDGSIQIRLTLAVYRAGEVDEQGALTPDMGGYRDIVNLIQKTKDTLLTSRFIKDNAGRGATFVRPPIKSGMYNEQPWPYWYGYIKFEATVPATVEVDLDL